MRAFVKPCKNHNDDHSMSPYMDQYAGTIIDVISNNEWDGFIYFQPANRTKYNHCGWYWKESDLVIITPENQAFYESLDRSKKP